MAGSSSPSRGSRSRPDARWPRELRHAAALLAASGVLYWMAFAFEGWTVWIAGVGLLYMDLIVAWIALLLTVMAWPDLWEGLRNLLAVHPGAADALVARRAFLMTVLLLVTAVFLLPLQYHVVQWSEVWLLVLYVTAFPFLAWIFVPTLALYGIMFGRIANFLGRPAKHLADAGAMLLFAVAAATTLVVLRDPSPYAFVRSWSVAAGILPAAACAGYLLIASALTVGPAPEPKPVPLRGWAAARTPRGGPERFA